MRLLDWCSFMRTPKVKDVFVKHQLRICGDDCEIWLQPAAPGRPPMTVKCKTEEAKKQIEALLKDIKA